MTPTPEDVMITQVRKFLREYGRPSTIDDLLDCVESPRLRRMLEGILRELIGASAGDE